MNCVAVFHAHPNYACLEPFFFQRAVCACYQTLINLPSVPEECARRGVRAGPPAF